MKRFLIGALLSLVWSGAALAQASCPTFYYGLVLTAAQWQACLDSKQRVLGYTPVNKAGDTMLGELITVASTTARAGLNVPPGTAPTSPSNGDFWTTSSGAFVRINGVTIGPLGGGSSSSFAATSPLAVTFPAGVVTYAITGAAGRVLAGAGPAFTATPTLGVAGSVLGQLIFANTTSGSITLQAAPGALGSAVLSLPAATDTIAALGVNNAFTGNNTYSGTAAFNTTNPTLTGYNTPLPYPGSKAATVFQSTVNAGSGAGDAVNTIVNGIVAAGYPGTTYVNFGVGLRPGVASLDYWNGFFVIDFQSGIPAGGAVLAALTQGTVSANQTIDGLRVVAENVGSRADHGVIVSSTLSANAFSKGVQVLTSHDWGVAVGGIQNGDGAFLPSIPFIFAKNGTALWSITNVGPDTGANQTLAGIFTSTASGGGTNAGVIVSSTQPAMAWYETDESANNRLWDVIVSGTGFFIRACSDAGVCQDGLRLGRSGATVTQAEFPSSPLKLGADGSQLGSIIFAGNISGNTTLTGPGAGSGTINLPRGSTDFSALGGTSQVVKLTTLGGPFTVARLACSDLSDSASGCSAAAGITALTGDVTASGSGSVAATLATAQPAVHTWALAQTFTVAPVFTDASGSRTALGLGTMATQAASAVAITGGTISGLTGLAIRDTSAAFDVTIAATSSTTLTAGRTLTLNMQNVAHIVSFGTTANTGSGIIFPNTATDTVAMLGVANAFTGNNTYSGTNLFTGALASTGSNGQASIGASATAGAVLGGKGSSKDLTLANSAGTSVCDIATGGTTINCTTLTLTNQLAGSQVAAAANTSGAPSATFGVVKCDGTTTSCTSGVVTVLGGAATSIAVGTTTVTSGTTGRIFYDNASVLGELIIGNGLENSSGTLGVTSARRTLPTTSIAASNNHTGGMSADSSGTYTVPANVLWIEVFMVGGGGGGAGTAGAGSPTVGADTCIKASATPCTTPLLAAGGGAAGASRNGGAGGTISGSGTANILAVAGGDGGSNQDLAAVAGTSNGSSGGNSCLGGAGTGATGSGNAGAGKANTGGGGGGNTGNNAADPGGGGGSGACLRTIINTPSATYTYSVGAGGTAGTSAGAGGTGYIVIIEHYGS